MKISTLLSGDKLSLSFEVFPPEMVAEKVKELDVPIVGLSALMTTTVPAMEGVRFAEEINNKVCAF